MHNATRRKFMKIIKWQPMIILLVLSIFCGMAASAFAAGAEDEPWDIRAALTRENDQGEKEVNEELLLLTQDVSQTVVGEYLRIAVSEALFDGRSMLVAWEMENLSDQLIVLMAYPTEDSVNWRAGFMVSDLHEELMNAGEQRNFYLDASIWEFINDIWVPVTGDAIHVGIRFTALSPAVEVVYVSRIDPMEIIDVNNLTKEEEDYVRKMLAAQEAIKTGLEEGKFVIESSGSTAWMHKTSAFYEEVYKQYELRNYECTYPEAVVATGMFTLLAELDVVFDLNVPEKITSFLPNGEPVEKEFEDFTMRITQADFTKSTMKVSVEATFASLEAYQKFSEGYGSDGTRKLQRFVALDEEGLVLSGGDGSSWGEANLQEADDGAVIAEYFITHWQLFRLPEYVNICPAALATSDSGPFLTAIDTMEGIVLTLR
jgi:hypothetical protein